MGAWRPEGIDTAHRSVTISERVVRVNTEAVRRGRRSWANPSILQACETGTNAVCRHERGGHCPDARLAVQMDPQRMWVWMGRRR